MKAKRVTAQVAFGWLELHEAFLYWTVSFEGRVTTVSVVDKKLALIRPIEISDLVYRRKAWTLSFVETTLKKEASRAYLNRVRNIQRIISDSVVLSEWRVSHASPSPYTPHATRQCKSCDDPALTKGIKRIRNSDTYGYKMHTRCSRYEKRNDNNLLEHSTTVSTA